jgi:hypothetical protein
VDKANIRALHTESLTRMLDLLQNGTDSLVLHKNPL